MFRMIWMKLVMTMPIPWSKRKDRVRAWWEVQKENGTLAYWKKRARWLNARVLKHYGITDTIQASELMTLYEESNACVDCKQNLTPGEVHFDHVEALAKGGKHNIKNIAIRCEKHNLSKGKQKYYCYNQEESEDDLPVPEN